jgi:hypothetical protein
VLVPERKAPWAGESGTGENSTSSNFDDGPFPNSDSSPQADSLRHAAGLILETADLGNTRISRLVAFLLLKAALLALRTQTVSSVLPSTGFVGVTLVFIAELSERNDAERAEFARAEVNRLREWGGALPKRGPSAPSSLSALVFGQEHISQWEFERRGTLQNKHGA